MHPDRTGSDRDGRLRRIVAALSDEPVMQCDLVHEAGPDHQRIGSVGGAKIAMATPFDDEPDIVVAREVDRGNDVAGLPRSYSIDTGLESPAVGPAQGLGNAKLVPDVVGIFQFLEELAAVSRPGALIAGCEWHFDLQDLPPTAFLSFSHASADGQPGSDGRTRWTALPARTWALAGEDVEPAN